MGTALSVGEFALYLPDKDELGWKKDNMAERKKVLPLINEFNDCCTPEYPLVLQNQGIFGAFRIQSFYEDDDADADHLEAYQKVMDAFAEFAIRKYEQSS